VKLFIKERYKNGTVFLCVEIIVLIMCYGVCDKCRLCYQVCTLKASSAYRYYEEIQLV